MSLLKKFVVTTMAIVTLSFVCIPSTSFAYEVEINVPNEGQFWIESNSIRCDDGIYSAAVFYFGHDLVGTWKYYQEGEKWYVQHPGTGPNWYLIPPNDTTSNTYILKVILSFI